MRTISSAQADTFYRAYVCNDSRFEGIFFLAVKTTGIFCRPGCKAKTPKKENVEFFPTAKLAIASGYRACKKCRPLQPVADFPAWVQQALSLVSEHPEIRVSDAKLKSYQIDPVRLRRWFKNQLGITFQAYQRSHKIGRASTQIKQGEKVIDSAYDNGYSSLSGFNESFKKVTGFVPSASRQQKIASTTQITTALGPMLAAASDNGLCLLEFCDRETLDKQIARVQHRLGVLLVAGQHELFKTLQNQLDEYFNQQRRQFEIPLELGGTEFQRQAWSYLQSIPYAETRSYQQEAASIGNPAAVRAVGHANGQNAIAIIIPCHRVISKNGGLAGYAGGIWRKKFLLDLEQAGPVPL